jgi:hypothetical protein
MFDGKTSGGDAALAVNAAERRSARSRAPPQRNDAPPPAAKRTARRRRERRSEGQGREQTRRRPAGRRALQGHMGSQHGQRARRVRRPGRLHVAYTKAVEAGKVKQLRKAA